MTWCTLCCKSDKSSLYLSTVWKEEVNTCTLCPIIQIISFCALLSLFFNEDALSALLYGMHTLLLLLWRWYKLKPGDWVSVTLGFSFSNRHHQNQNSGLSDSRSHVHSFTPSVIMHLILRPYVTYCLMLFLWSS